MAEAVVPQILVFDSGLGGLTVFDAVAKARPDANITYLADDALFPYGDLAEEMLVARVGAVLREAVGEMRPDVIVIACHTASTLVLPPLRAEFPDLPIVGTVPAIKPAAAITTSGLISVLATPGTVKRDYTRALIDSFAGHCAVTLVGAKRLAALAEQSLHGEAVSDEAILAEIAPAFVREGARRTDAVVLACTHYPLLLPTLERLAPWPVAFIDPAPAIARRVVHLLGEGTAGESPGGPHRASFTSGRIGPALAGELARRGFAPPEMAGAVRAGV